MSRIPYGIMPFQFGAEEEDHDREFLRNQQAVGEVPGQVDPWDNPNEQRVAPLSGPQTSRPEAVPEPVQALRPRPLIPQEAVPFTQADSLALQKLQQNQAQIQEQLSSGELNEQEAADLNGQVMSRMTPLQQRKAKFEEQNKQQMVQQQMQDQAMAFGMQQQNGMARAKGFPQTVSEVVDPMTGEVTRFFQQPDGQWEQIQASEKEMAGFRDEQRQAMQSFVPGGIPPGRSPGEFPPNPEPGQYRPKEFTAGQGGGEGKGQGEGLDFFPHPAQMGGIGEAGVNTDEWRAARHQENMLRNQAEGAALPGEGDRAVPPEGVLQGMPADPFGGLRGLVGGRGVPPEEQGQFNEMLRGQQAPMPDGPAPVPQTYGTPDGPDAPQMPQDNMPPGITPDMLQAPQGPQEPVNAPPTEQQLQQSYGTPQGPEAPEQRQPSGRVMSIGTPEYGTAAHARQVRAAGQFQQLRQQGVPPQMAQFMAYNPEGYKRLQASQQVQQMGMDDEIADGVLSGTITMRELRAAQQMAQKVVGPPPQFRGDARLYRAQMQEYQKTVNDRAESILNRHMSNTSQLQGQGFKQTEAEKAREFKAEQAAKLQAGKELLQSGAFKNRMDFETYANENKLDLQTRGHLNRLYEADERRKATEKAEMTEKEYRSSVNSRYDKLQAERERLLKADPNAKLPDHLKDDDAMYSAAEKHAKRLHGTHKPEPPKPAPGQPKVFDAGKFTVSGITPRNDPATIPPDTVVSVDGKTGQSTSTPPPIANLPPEVQAKVNAMTTEEEVKEAIRKEEERLRGKK